MPDVVRRQVAPPSPTFDDDISSEIEDFSDIAATQNTAFLEEEGLLQEEVAGDGQLGEISSLLPHTAVLWRCIAVLSRHRPPYHTSCLARIL